MLDVSGMPVDCAVNSSPQSGPTSQAVPFGFERTAADVDL
jgi:hypothetical protein